MQEKKLKQLIDKKSKFSQNKIQVILQKTKYNQPEIYNQSINLEILIQNNIPTNKPVFVVYENELNFSYAKNLYLANFIFPFTLIVFFENEIFEYKQFLPFAIFLNSKKTNHILKTELFKLNINNHNKPNIFQASNQNVKIENFNRTKTKFQNFYLETKFESKISYIKLKKTYYFGNYYFFEINNKNNKKIKIKIIKKLKNNIFNYFFIKNNFIYSVFEKNKFYFYCTEKNFSKYIYKDKKTLSFYFVIEIFSNKNFSFYFGTKNYCLKNFNNIINHISNQFSLKIFCENKKLEYLFNEYMPCQIIKEKLNNTTQISFSNCKNFTFNQIILLLKNKIISTGSAYKKIQEHIFYIEKNNIFLRKLEYQKVRFCFNYDDQQKEFLIFSSPKKRLVFNNTTYNNLSSITTEILEKNNKFEFYL